MNRFSSLLKRIALESYFLYFTVFLASRFLYWAFCPMNALVFVKDSLRYDKLSQQILDGNYNLDIGSFIVAPFYPFFVATAKVLFGTYWLLAIGCIQNFMAAVAGVYLLKILHILTPNIKSKYWLSILYAVYPFTLFYTYALLQESLFQSFYIMACYYFLKTLKPHLPQPFAVIKFSFLFSLAFLTKSHILLGVPIVFLLWTLLKEPIILKLKKIGQFCIICGVMTLPNGLYNYYHNGAYTLSSDGFAMFFFWGQSEYAYKRDVLHVSIDALFEAKIQERDTAYLLDLEGERFSEDPIVVSEQRLLQLPRGKNRDKYFWKSALVWIQTHPNDYFWLKVEHFRHGISPGVSSPPYSFSTWLMVLIVTLPIYFLGYVGMFNFLRQDFRGHMWSLLPFGTLLLLCSIAICSMRFRIITIEPTLLIYTALLLGNCRKNQGSFIPSTTTETLS